MPDALPDARCYFLQGGKQGRGRHQVLGVGSLSANRFAQAIRAHGTLVDTAAGVVEVVCRLAEMRDQFLQRQAAQVCPHMNPQPPHAFRSPGSHAIEPAHRQGGDKFRTLPGPDNEHAIRLVLVGGNLGQEFVVADTGTGGQARLLPDRRADQAGHLDRTAYGQPVPRDIEIGLVQRQWLDQVAVAGKYFPDLPGHRPVGIESRRHENQRRTTPRRRDRWHGRAHAEPPGLVTGRGHDTAAG